ncbi:lytic transglycosylase domain-containing protein [Paracoccus contaminans]|uniref:lytic transglycosylase domain-containing protein n=1 Tax=Paracoccus contaminans TaxID=1945662 RepID=UPI0012F51459|nr:lytic transglycosylase domain-containing protein [Paracoccus contaminans]
MKARLLPFALALLTAAPACAEDAALIARALAAAGARDWAGAETAARASGPMALDLVLWQRLRAGQGSWAEYRGFAARHPDWPGMELLLRRGEAALREDLPAPEVLAWFGDRLPLTANGARAWIAAQPAAKRAEAAGRWWVQAAALDPRDEVAMLAAHGPALAPWHGARISALLDKGEWAAAERMLTLIPAGPAADLARARIAVQARRPGVDALILALPEAQRADAGLALDRFRWRVAARQGDLARALMLERSTSAEGLGNPAAWAAQRRDMARAALRAGDWAMAERLAANHFLPAGDDAQDLDWLAGYGALRAGAADRAAAYFARLPATGSGPITLSRTHYWRGRAAEAAGDAAGARASYAEAARHQTAFYGQLAAERIGAPMQAGLALPGAGVDSLPDWRGAALRGNGVFQAGLWLVAAGDGAQAQRFFLHLAETAAPDDIARMARLMMELHRPWDALRLGKAAAAKGGVWPAIYFPLTGLERADTGLPAELVLSIARRESEFNHTVSSPAGAKGLMQVMPDTARLMAALIAEPFEPARLTQDAAYNARLGAAYLRGLRGRFGHSVALVAAGYNAGPGRSARWLRDIGDLRLAGPQGVDPVDWVEMIPFDETRTYVMRVAESLPIYRARIAGHPVPLVPSWDLRGGLSEPPPAVSPLVLALSDRPRPAAEWVRAAAARARALAVATAGAGAGAQMPAATGGGAQTVRAAPGGKGGDDPAGAGMPAPAPVPAAAPAPAATPELAAPGPAPAAAPAAQAGTATAGQEAAAPPIPAAQIAAVAAALAQAGPLLKPAARPGAKPPASPAAKPPASAAAGTASSPAAGPPAGAPASAAPAGSAADPLAGGPVSPAARPASSATR